MAKNRIALAKAEVGTAGLPAVETNSEAGPVPDAMAKPLEIFILLSF
jgi:hypothetical protein